MTIKLRDEFVKVEVAVGENTSQTVVEGTVVVPAHMPSIDRVLKVTAVPQIGEKRVEEDRVNVEGGITIMLIYAGEGDAGDIFYGSTTFADAVSFSHVVDIPGAEHNMQARCRVAVADLQTDVKSDGHTVDLDLILEISARVSYYHDSTLVTEVLSLPETVKVDAEPLRIEDVIGCESAQAEFNDVLTLPDDLGPALRLLEVRPEFMLEEKRVVADKAIFTGNVSYKVLYVRHSGEGTQGEELAVYGWTHATHVEVSLDIPGARPGMTVYSQVDIGRATGKVTNNGHAFRVDGMVWMEGKVVQPRSLTVVTDLISGDEVDIAVRKETLQFQEITGAEEKQVHVEGIVELPESRPPMERVLDFEVRAAPVNISITGGRVLVEGYIDLAMMYIGRTDDFTQPAYYAEWKNAGTFEASVGISGAATGMDVDVDISEEEVRYELINRETLEYNLTLRVNCRVSESLTREVVAEAVEVKSWAERPPTYICVTVQPGDSLWRLASHYRITVEEILKNNNDLEEVDYVNKLPVGYKLYIPKPSKSSKN